MGGDRGVKEFGRVTELSKRSDGYLKRLQILAFLDNVWIDNDPTRPVR